MQCVDGSLGTRLHNNIFINDAPFSIEVDKSSAYRHRESHNVANTVNSPKPEERRIDDPATTLDVTQAKAAAEFIRASDEPWIIIERKWWRLNPNRPDFRPVADSTMFGGHSYAEQLPKEDLSGTKRTTSSVGALAPAQSGAAR